MRTLPILFLLLCFSGFSQSYRVINYSIKNGLPQNSVNGLMWDKQNLLWILTEDGAVRFDGNKFTVLREDSNAGMHKDRFRTIVPAEGSSCMLTSSAGTIYRTEGVELKLLLGKVAHRDIVIDRMDTKEARWLFSKEIVTQGQQHSWRMEPLRLAHTGEVLWVLGKETLFRYDHQRITDSFPLPPEVNGIYTINGKIFLTTKTLLYSVDPLSGNIHEQQVDWPEPLHNKDKRWFTQPYSESLLVICDNRVMHVSAGSEGELTARTLYVIQAGEIEGVISASVYNEELGMLALGTWSNGLYLVKPSYFHTMKDEGIYAHAKFNDTTIITSAGTLHTEHTKTGVSGFDLSRIKLRNLVIDKRGNLWSNKNDSLLVQKIGGPRSAMYMGKPFRIQCMMMSGDTLLALTHVALLKIYGRHIDTVIFKQSFFKPGDAMNMAIFRDTLLIGAEKGVFSLNTKTGEIKLVYGVANVWTLGAWNDYLVGSSFHYGLFIWHNHEFRMLPIDPHQYLKKAHQFYKGPRGMFFVSTNNGLMQTEMRWITDYLEGKRSNIPWQYYTSEDGIENVEFNGGCTPGTVELGNGIVSFANMGGLVWFRPLQVGSRKPVYPKLYLAKVTVDNVAQPVSDTIRIPARGEAVAIQPGCIYWYNPLDICIAYRLDGYMSEFRQLAGPDDQAVFTRLPAGTYRLLIRGSAGVRGNREDDMVVVIIKEPRFYETAWFITLIVFAIAGAVVTGNKVYNQRLIKRNKLLEEKVQKRTRELQQSNYNLMSTQEELLQSIGIKNKLISIIAHDLITPLKFISRVSRDYKRVTVNDEKAGTEMLNEIYHTSQRIYDNAQNVLNWIRYQNNTIAVKKIPVAPFVIGDEIAELFSDVAALRNSTISNHIEMEDMISTDKTIVGIVLHNMVSNAVKYTRDAAIVLTSSKEKGKYTITVTDNGPGMSPQSLKWVADLRNNIRNSSETTSLGYIIILELSALIGADVEIESSPEKGTAVKLVLPDEQEGPYQ
jgi:signal transduction histidine kinase